MKDENRYNELINQIDLWNCKNVDELLALIEEANAIRGDDYDYVVPIEIELLNTSEKYLDIPDHLWGSYPIWAIDDNGYCLVGETALEIEHISTILED